MTSALVNELIKLEENELNIFFTNFDIDELKEYFINLVYNIVKNKIKIRIDLLVKENIINKGYFNITKNPIDKYINKYDIYDLVWLISNKETIYEKIKDYKNQWFIAYKDKVENVSNNILNSIMKEEKEYINNIKDIDKLRKILIKTELNNIKSKVKSMTFDDINYRIIELNY